jgi:hypothetical protein
MYLCDHNYISESLVVLVKRLISDFGIEASSVNEAQSHSTMPTFGNYEWLQTAHLSNRAHLNRPCLAHCTDLIINPTRITYEEWNVNSIRWLYWNIATDKRKVDFSKTEVNAFIVEFSFYSSSVVKYSDFLDRARLLTQMLFKQGYVVISLKSSLQKLYSRHHLLVGRYKTSISQMTMDFFT